MIKKFIFLPIFFCLSMQSSAWAHFHIIIDPGHGGTDKGAVRGKALESEIVLKVAQQLQKQLQSQNEITVSMTREQNKNLSLQERVKIAEKAKADLFVSIHANASVDHRAKGVEFYFQNALPPDEESLFLASLENQNTKDSISAENTDEPSKKGDVAAILEDLHRQYKIENSLKLSRSLQEKWSGENNKEKITIKQAPFYVISKTNMPAVLIEIGFLSNGNESQKLLNENYQAEIAKKIYSALLTYKEKIDKESTVRHIAE